MARYASARCLKAVMRKKMATHSALKTWQRKCQPLEMKHIFLFVTLAFNGRAVRLLFVGNMETEVVTSYNQEGLSVEWREHQLTHRTFNLKFILSTRCAGLKLEQNLKD